MFSEDTYPTFSAECGEGKGFFSPRWAKATEN